MISRTLVFLFATAAAGAAPAAADVAPSPTPAVSAAASPPPASGAAPAPSAAAEPSSASPVALDPAVLARAKEWFHRIQTGTVDRSQLDDQMNGLLTDALVKSAAAQFGPLGDPTSFAYADQKTIGKNTGYFFKVGFKTTSVYWLFSTDTAGKITGLRIIPNQ